MLVGISDRDQFPGKNFQIYDSHLFKCIMHTYVSKHFFNVIKFVEKHEFKLFKVFVALTLLIGFVTA